MVLYFHFCFNCLTFASMLELKLYLCIFFWAWSNLDTGLFQVFNICRRNKWNVIIRLLFLISLNYEFITVWIRHSARVLVWREEAERFIKMYLSTQHKKYRRWANKNMWFPNDFSGSFEDNRNTAKKNKLLIRVYN